MTTVWYPITPIHPAPLVQVAGIIMHEHGGAPTYDRDVIISRGRAPHTNMWATWLRGKAVPLASHARPIYWRPQNPATWSASLPDPVELSDLRIWSSQDGSTTLRDDTDRDGQWWRDASRIKYEPSGEVSERMAEGRVMRAVAACGHGHGMTMSSRTVGMLLADLARQYGDDPYPTSDYAPRIRQTRSDISDFETAMGWFVQLDPPDLRSDSRAVWSLNRMQNVLVWRARNQPWSYGVIGDRLGMTPDGARKLYQRTIRAVWRAANGNPAFSHVSTGDPIEHLRRRKR